MIDTNYKKKMSLTGLVAQLVTIGLLFIFWRLGQKWVVIPAAAILIFLFFFLPKAIGKLEQRFHKKALMMLSTGKAADVPPYAARQVLLSLFGASAPVDAKLGLALVQLGRFDEAVDCLAHAIPFAPTAELPGLQSAYVKSLLITGDAARAEAEGRSILKNGSVRLPEVLILTARARLGLEKTGPETAALLEEAESHVTSGDVELMRLLTQIEFQLVHRRKPSDLPNDADSTQPFMRVWIHLVRGKLREHRGKIKEALASYSKAVQQGKEERCWFADMARRRIEQLSAKADTSTDNADIPSHDTPSSASAASGEDAALDDVARRKRRRRR
ncbi:MAG: hypothetical protein JXX14_10520 [Deltaproteobacteria bacterium]|nr:hypothetical protein [Deltaproteobacteria bacterium]